jgi:hypothetical protein
LKRRRLGSVPVRGGNRLGTCRSLRRDGALGLRRRSKQVLVASSNRRRAHQGEHRRVGASRSGACRRAAPDRGHGAQPWLASRARRPHVRSLAARPGSGSERRRDAAQRRVCWRIARLAPRARRFLRITGTSAACAPHERLAPPSVATTCASAPRGSDSRSLARRSSRATRADHGRAG